MPPREAPGPTGVLQIMSPSSALSAQKMPLFWPKPTMLPSRLGPDPPRSKSGLLGTGQFGFGPEEVRHATVQVSKVCSFLAHLICPVFKSSARAVSKKSSAAVQSARGVASWHATTSGGTVYLLVCPPLSGMTKVFQRIAPVLALSATTLPRKLQHGYVGSVARVSSFE